MEAQTERVTKLFERQLQIPHGNMQATMEEYEQWRLLGGNQNPVDDKIRKAFVDARTEEGVHESGSPVQVLVLVCRDWPYRHRLH